MSWQEKVTILIPAFNEEEGIGRCVEQLINLYPSINLLIVDDGSTDQTYETAKTALKNFEKKAKVLRHPYNRGYGASIKTAVRHTKTPILVWFDADLQHDPNDIYNMVKPILSEEADAVLGARSKGSAFVIKRVPGKMILRFVSQIVARQKIPDLNCGFRAFKTSILRKYLHLLPDGFSASSTTTLLMIKRNYRTIFYPTKVSQRVGQSYVKIFRDGFLTLRLIFRIVLLFDAFLFFSIFALIQIIAGLIYSVNMVYSVGLGLPPLGVLVITSGLLTFFMGIISYQISEMRQERFEVDSNNFDLVEN